MMLRSLLAGVAVASLVAAMPAASFAATVPATPIDPVFAGVGVGQAVDQPAADWWLAFHDPVLDRLVARALEVNRDLLAAEAEARRGLALAKVQGWTLLPIGSLSAAAGRQRSVDLGESDTVAVGAQASWEIDVFGRLRGGVSAARADARALEEARRGVMASLTAQTAQVYADLRGAQARLAAGESAAAAQDDTLRLTDALRAGGRATPLDVMRARTQVEATRAALPLLQAQIIGDIAALDVLTAGLPDDLKAQLIAPADLVAPQGQMAVGWPEDLLRRRPDIRQAEARLIAANARVRASRVDWWPRLSILGAVTSAAVDVGGLGESRGFSFNVGPQIDWPALDFRRNALRTEAAKAGAEAEFLRYDKAVLAGVRDVETALANLQAARQSERRLADAAQAARGAADVSHLRYRQGVDAYFTVLDAQRTLAQTDDELAVARTRSSLAYIRLGQALGAGWSDAPRRVAAN